MVDFDYSAAGAPIRDDLREGQRFLWARLGTAGTWWTGAERVAIAAEARRAPRCGLCRRRREAVSPNAVSGDHDATGVLPQPTVDVIHRIATDPGRLSRPWFEKVVGSDLETARYVELVGVVAFVAGIDSFARALGIPAPELPQPSPGEPSRHRPQAARAGEAWVPMVAPEDAQGPEEDLYGGSPFVPNIMRALSLVPDEARALQRSSSAHYVPVAQIGDPTVRRTLDRMQMELVAARVSALNECFY